MQEFAKNVPEIIKAAAASNLGIVALMSIVFSALAYGFFRRSKDIWRFAALVLLFAGCMSFGFAVFRSAKEVPAPVHEIGLSATVDKWIAEADIARSAGTVSPGTTPPTSLVEARNQFESAWKQASLGERKSQNAQKISKALSYANRLYRLTENDSSLKPNANYWADEAINYFQEIQNSKLLTEALLDKAAIFLDVAQLGNNDKQQFEKIARDGDALMTRAYQIADLSQRPIVLRITSRFYYNLARPKSFRLSDNWDNNYLLLAFEKAEAARNADPKDFKNVTELMRTAIRVSKNPPQNADKEWTKRLRDAQQKMKTAWQENQSGLAGVDQRLSPLDVFGVATLETIAREWRDMSRLDRKSKGADLISQIDSDALSPLREAAALLQNSELRQSYGFDLYFDIARAHAVRAVITREISVQSAPIEFSEVKVNLETARENAKTSQLEAAIRDVDNELTFAMLTQSERSTLRGILAVHPNGA